ncbi:MAG: DUF4918 family protein [Bacteroidales bacterium]|nr:DUF4918 family protein [Bacteroidales bacterium]
MSTFAERVIEFNRGLKLTVQLPAGIRAMNPFTENPSALAVSSEFYRKYYSDNIPRRLILGINPGRFGAGVTGIPFTDTRRLTEKCGLVIPGIKTYEPSSVFVYEVIDAYGGPDIFYRDFYINSPSPLGFVARSEQGKELNHNYYDSTSLAVALKPFMAESVKAHIAIGTSTDIAICLGTGKNFKYLSALNSEYAFFRRLIPLEHPRFIMQYKSKEKDAYIEKYLQALRLQ